MKVLVCGAAGFVGRHVAGALRAAGHTVVEGVSRPRGAHGEVVVDFARDTDAATWLPRLAGIDAVVNAVGILRGTRARPMQAVHADAPAALFAACAQVGVRRVLHVSALGIAAGDTPYAVTKRQAEAALLALHAQGRLQATVLRPSIVFGPGGASSALFLNLARLPLLVLPGAAVRARVQPVHVRELAEAVAHLLPDPAAPAALDIVGPRPLALGDFIGTLRRQQGGGPARVLALPDAPTRWSAQLADRVPVTPWGTQALALLAQDNVGDAGALRAVLGRAATPPERLLAGADADA